MTKTSRILGAAALVLALGGCNSLLDTSPVDQLPEDIAITTPEGAEAALVGAYNSLQDASYYGGDLLLMGDIGSDDAIHIGIYNQYDNADVNQLRSDNTYIRGMWRAMYAGIHRTNVLLERVPNVPGIDPAERDQILGEAHFLRGLHYFNLVRYFGGVPLRTTPAASLDEASNIARATEAETYAQIISDFQQAEQLMVNTSPTTRATPGAATAMLAKVYLTQGDYPNAILKANEVEALGYTLATNFSDLFPDDESDTPEDIFKVTFTDVQYQYMYYWITCAGSEGGGCELAPSQDLIDAFTDPYDAVHTDARQTWSINGTTAPDAWGTKYPTTAGAEDIHAVRFADIILVRAEAEANQNQLAAAVNDINLIRVRAGIDPITLNVEVTTQQEVLDEVIRQRRLELFAEGDRWFTLVRTGLAVSLMGIPQFQTLYPIPLAELDVAPNIVQNPGY